MTLCYERAVVYDLGWLPDGVTLTDDDHRGHQTAVSALVAETDTMERTRGCVVEIAWSIATALERNGEWQGMASKPRPIE